jgi:hypothetical protein
MQRLQSTALLLTYYRGAVPEDSGHGDADFGLCDEWLPVVLAELHSDVEAIGEVFANSRLRQS